MSEELTISTEETGISKSKTFDVGAWNPKTEIGRQVKLGKITNIDQILSSGKKILESEIIDILLPDLTSDLILVGQSKGKFGGGKRSIWKQTQKKTKEGNKPRFATMAIVGNKKGYIGLGYGKAKETVPAREKAVKRAKLNLIKIKLGCGSWEGDIKGDNSIPFAVEGKCGSVRIKLMPAPKGTSLVIEKECAKMLQISGIKDIYSRSFGHTATKINLIKACFDALQKLSTTKVKGS